MAAATGHAPSVAAAARTVARPAPRVTGAALKVVMAVTGVVFIGYVFAHMVGNLKVFLGRGEFDEYAAFLRRLGVPLIPHEWVLWALRGVLFVCLVAHVASAAILTGRSRAGATRTARPRRAGTLRSFTSRTMLVSGIVLLAFIVFHILDLTLGVAGAGSFRHPEKVAGEDRFYAYENLVASFERPVVAAFYIVAMVVLAAHLIHGSWSVIHDLGVTGARLRRALWIVGSLVAVVVMIGNISIPVSVLAGLVD